MPPPRTNRHQHASRVLLDMTECGRTMAHLFDTAFHTIIYSAFVCVLDTPLLGTQDPTITMKHLVHAAVRRGVKVQMRINPSCAYGNRVEDVEWLQSVGVDVCLVVGDGTIPPPFHRVFGPRYTNHHQKFLLVDDQRMMVGGTDVDAMRKGWMELNNHQPHPYCWHEVAVLIHGVSPSIAHWIRDPTATTVSTPTPPYPFVAAQQEHDTMCRLIHGARTCVYMEAQVCISTSFTQNKVLKSVADRLVRAFYTPLDPFCFMMVVDVLPHDEHDVVKVVTAMALRASIYSLVQRVKAAGVARTFIDERVVVATMANDPQQTTTTSSSTVKVHSNIMVVDGHTMVRSSSNLTDRSLCATPCDNELGVVVTGEPVAVALQQLWRRYFGIPSSSHTSSQHILPHQAFQMMTQNTGVMRKFPLGHTSSLNWVSHAVLSIVHPLPFFGRRTQVGWAHHTIPSSPPK